MSLAKGLSDNLRRPLIREHRMNKYLQAMNNLIDGQGSTEYVAMRFKKYKEIK